MKEPKILNHCYAIFRPDVQEYIKKTILTKPITLLDPMAGTAPLIPYIETHGQIAFLNDILPVHFFINKAKQYSIFKIYKKHGYKWVLNKLLKYTKFLKGYRLCISDKWIDDKVLKGFIHAWKETERHEDNIKVLLQAVIVKCIRPFSSISKSKNPTWIRVGGVSSDRNLKEIIEDSLSSFDRYYNSTYESYPIIQRGKCIFTTQDASLLKLKQKADVIVTSPSYCNRLDNARLYAPENYFLYLVTGLKINTELIGTNKVSDYLEFDKDFGYLTSKSRYLKSLLNKIGNLPERDTMYYLKYYTRYFSMLNKVFSNTMTFISRKGKAYIIVQDNCHRGELIEIDRALDDLICKGKYRFKILKKWERHHLGLRNISRSYAFVKKRHFEKLIVIDK